MPSAQVNQAIIFADIAGSSKLFHEVGNKIASERINQTLTTLSEQASVLGGVLVKNIGDEIMLRFPSVDSAAIAIREMQRYLSQQTTPLKLKIGASYGPVINHAGDVFGEAVNDAACVAKIAKADQIIITTCFYEALSTPQRAFCQIFDLTLLKGKRQKHLIYRMDWDNVQQHCTQVIPVVQLTAEHDSTPFIELEINGKKVELTAADLPFSFGRDRQRVDCFVPSALASRHHCELLFRRKKFVLVDHSTNGTFIRQEYIGEVYLRREETPLQGRGQITFGQPTNKTKEPIIHYHIQ